MTNNKIGRIRTFFTNTLGFLAIAVFAIPAQAESVWVLGSYRYISNARAEEVRLSALLERKVYIRFSESTQTYRVMTAREGLTREMLAVRNIDNWRLELDPYDSVPGLHTVTPAQPGTAGPSPSGAIILSSDPTKDSRSKQKRKSKFVPPGFEELLEPQTTLVDVYYGGVFLGSSTATFTPTSISFATPADVVEKIPDVLDPETIEKVLATEMPTNSAFACVKANQTDCGKIDTESVDVIFDDSRFRADLFIAPQLLSVRPAVTHKYLPPSTAGLSLLNVTSATVNGQEGLGNNYNVGNSTTIAYKETRLFGVSNITNTDDLTFDTLALQREFNGQMSQAGIFRSSPGNLVFLGEADFAGVSIASSLDTRTDLNQSSGNDLQVFLATRSRVDILKDGRLISTAVYDAGNQILDTSQLPGGAYEIVLRIRDNFGGFSEETRFYVKTNRLPPKDQTLYFFDIGETVAKIANKVLPESTGEGFARAGVAKRITSNFGGEFGVSATEQDHLIEAGIFKLGRLYELQLNYAAGSDKSEGASINARTRLGRITLSANGRRVRTDSPDSVLGPELTQTSLNLTVPLGRATFNVTSRYNRRATGTDRNLGVRLDLPTFSFGKQVLDTSIQFTENNDDTLVLVGFRLSHRSDRWQNRVAAQYYEDEITGLPRETGYIGNISSNWQDGDKYLSDVSLTLRGVEERTDRTFETKLDYASDLGRMNVEAVYSDESRRMSYGANLFTSIVANSSTLSLGGKTQARSALVLDVDGEAKDAYFDVLVNGSTTGNARIGKKTIVGLAPYQTYDVLLQPKGDSLVDFNDSAKSVTLYPGNVVTMNYEVTRVLVAFGQIVDRNGEPIKNALIEGVLGLATTDQFGFFQAEIESRTNKFTVRTRDRRCSVRLPRFDSTQLIVMLETLECL